MYVKQYPHDRVNTGRRHRGLSTIAAAIAVGLGPTAQAVAQETSDSTRLLDRITVVGSAEKARDIPGSAHFIDAEELEKHEYSDIHRVLRMVPGVNIQEEEGYGLRPNIGMRGTGVDRSQRITLMEDGILAAPAPYAAPAAYYFPSIGRMESVEVRKGSSSIKYGPNTTGGALNLISTSIPRQFGGRVNVGIGEDSTRRIHTFVGDSGERAGYLLETFQYQSDGFKELDGGGNTGFDTTDYLAKFRVNTAPEAGVYQELELKLGTYDETSHETYLGLTDDDFNATPYRRYAASQRDIMNVEQEQYSLRHYFELSPQMDVTTTVYRQDVARNWYKLDRVAGTGISAVLDDPGANAVAMGYIRGGTSPDDALTVKNNNREYYSHGVQSVLGWSIAGDSMQHALEVGLRYHQDEEDRFQWVDGYRMDNGTMVLTSAGTPGTDANRISSADAWAVFIQDTVTMGDWIVQPGLRYENIDTRREDFGTADPGRTGSALTVREDSVDVVMPGIGVTRHVNPNLSLIAGVHRGFTPPAPGTEDAEAEDSINFEAGFRYGSDNLQGEVIGFYNRYDNLLGTCTASSGGGCTIGDQFNGGEVEVTGIEAGLQHDLGAGRDLGFGIPVRLAYTYTTAEFKTGFNSGFDEWGDVVPGDELPYLPEHQLAAGIGLERAAWQVDLTAKYLGEMRTVAGQGGIPADQKVDSHVVLDLGGDYRLTDDAKVFVTVQNLLDETYMVARRPAGARPGMPRLFMAGIKVDF